MESEESRAGSLADELAGEHHRYCGVRQGKDCDCYAKDRPVYVLARQYKRVVAALQEERKARKAVESVNAEEVLQRRTNLEAQITSLEAALQEAKEENERLIKQHGKELDKILKWLKRFKGIRV